jgi:hypothetical protein
MMTRRDVVTGGVLGTLTTAVAAAPAEAGQGASDAVAMANGFSSLKRSVDDLRTVVDDALRQPGLSAGLVGKVRNAFDAYLRANGHFPAFCEIGTGVFYDIYDWHVRHAQQIQIIQIAENRMAIQFMFTQLILRWENDAAYVGTPFDRG